MPKKVLSLLLLITLITGLIVTVPITASADTYGDLTYEIYNGEVAITDCAPLVTEIVIPSVIDNYPVTSIGDFAFYDCDSLTSITIGDSVTSIGKFAFASCESITDISIPVGITIIDESVFCGCTSLKEIEIPNGVTTIKRDAFAGCTGLTSVSIPGSVTSVGAMAFNNCTALTRVDVADLASWCEIDFPDPEANPLYHAKNLYFNGALLTDLNIPNGTKFIGKYTFARCANLASVTIPDSVTSIDNYAFMSSNGPTGLIIPDDVTYIGMVAFYGWKDLKSLTLSKKLTTIGSSAFEECSGLTSVVIPSSVTAIGESAFSGCKGLTSITIPRKITTISDSTFRSCTGLTSVTIPNSVTYIDKYAFVSCYSIKDVYYAGSEDDWKNIEINNKNNSNEYIINANIRYNHIEAFDVYKINGITIKDATGNELLSIPDGSFLATISFTNISADEDAVVLLAAYTANGAFKGLMYVNTEDVPVGSTIKLTLPVDNSDGDIVKLKAFCWDSISSMTELGESVEFPAQ